MLFTDTQIQSIQKYLRPLLRPFAFLYGVFTDRYHTSFDRSPDKSYHPQIKTIVVGNLRAGGSGKTPFIKLLASYFGENCKVGVLSRGYGRSSKGFYWVENDSKSYLVGDEPLEIKHSLDLYNVKVAVCEDRAQGIQRMCKEEEGLQFLLLDDAYQHRKVTPHFSFLLSEYSRPFYEDEVFPIGFLRERREGAKRANAFILTKCPMELSESEKNRLKGQARVYLSSEVPIFFSSISYGNPQSKSIEVLELGASVTVVTGISNPTPFVEYVKSRYSVRKHLAFPDHYSFNDKEIQNWKALNQIIITTEKDYRRIEGSEFSYILKEIAVFYIPIKVFIHEQQEFYSLLESIQ